ncbi:YkgJ family cysteine cluster protein [Lebetimonas sp. JS138]|uniref:YkgJ family cysteine cluster protein n=1 Tax=Lebetimonas sp. JS138 TaxID=990072 RepID=UPI000467B80A|nr:YkgJ family cysteine cluster protein [Lebetimonas sp. JS138]
MRSEKLISKDGFDFKFNPDACKKCKGNCCIGESGYIWVNPKEIEAIADFLGIDKNIFIDRFLIKVGYKYSIKEKPYKKGYACIFFENGCKIYPVRPNQCKTFPFWERYKDERYYEELKNECPGVIFKMENEK